MKTIIKRNPTTLTGYSLVIVNDDNTTQEYPIDVLKQDKQGNWLKLPENPANRQWLSITKMEGKDELEINPKGQSTSTVSSSPKSNRISFSQEDLDSLSEEERTIILIAYDKLAESRAKAKIMAEIAALKAKLEILEGKAE